MFITFFICSFVESSSLEYGYGKYTEDGEVARFTFYDLCVRLLTVFIMFKIVMHLYSLLVFKILRITSISCTHSCKGY